MRIEIKYGKIINPVADGIYELKKFSQSRSISQNKALYLWFRLEAEALNDAGFDMKKTIRQDIDIPWTPESVKLYLWKPVMEAMFQKSSTAKLESGEINKIFDVITREIGGRTGVYCEFPSLAYLMEEMR